VRELDRPLDKADAERSAAMQILTSVSEIANAFSELIERYQHVSLAVAWASEGFDGYELLIKHAEKIRCAIVGTHFYQTDPRFIEYFIDDQRVAFVQQPNGVFHPKVYLFENSGLDYVCLLGSANFTK
jgi:hypothetical protein